MPICFVICNNLAKVEISHKIATVPTFLCGSKNLKKRNENISELQAVEMKIVEVLNDGAS
jgi:hypothetical protein